jgi:hypothetical protein
MTSGSGETSTGRKVRKKSPRKLKGCASKPSTSERWKALWADPVWRAKTTAAITAGLRNRDKTKTRVSRIGVPDGMRAADADEAWAQARALGEKFIKIMEDKGEVEKVVVPGSEEEMAKIALQEAFVMAVSPLSDAKTKNASIRTVLEWTKSKPESKSKLTVNKAEDWLAEIAGDMEKADAPDAD